MFRLGENLKKYRTQNNLTQEQLAEVLGVSPQAVSRWELGSTYPDITLLPIIANYFDVTTDELFGINGEKILKEIDRIIEHKNKLHNQGKIAECISYLREKSEQFPNSASIAYELGNALYLELCRNRSKSADTLKEIVAITERAIKLDKGESYVTFAGKHLLCLAYCMAGETDKAYKIAAEEMPSLWVSRENLLPIVLNGDEETYQRQFNLLTFMDLSIHNLHHLSRKMDTPEKSIELLKKANTLAELLTGNDHKFYNERVFKCYLWIARAYCALNKTEEAMDNLELALKYAIMYEERPQQSNYNVFWLEGYTDDRSRTSKNSEETLYQYLLEKIEEEDFSVLHNTNRYAAFTEKVRNKQENLK
ncbi:MAG: helix-turn-helix domain-containing protein [Ruminococcaceae bacterium]|nr:helix-turn-helix domain-containing protein [Oscillospiraceae bacterium]